MMKLEFLFSQVLVQVADLLVPVYALVSAISDYSLLVGQHQLFRCIRLGQIITSAIGVGLA
jgi:hypothetical protein